VSRRMFRYSVPIDDHPHIVELSGISDAYGPLHVANADDLAVEFWAEHDDQALTRPRVFQVFGTGHALPEDAAWIGTCDQVAADG
jgi:hypothetical protein